jgi:hypothetical protein
MLSYTFQLWPAIRYGLGTLTNDWSAATTCLDTTDFKILPLIGVNRHINKALGGIHYTFGGVGLFDLAVEQHICRVNIFCQHYGSSLTVGKKLTTSMHWLQLQIGCVGCPLLEDFDKIGLLAPTSWIKSFWESLHKCPGMLAIRFDGVEFQRESDVTLIQMAVTLGLSGDELISFNRCRCYGNLILLSDVTNAAGSGIDLRFLLPRFVPHESSFFFPPEQPTKTDWRVWVTFWTQWLTMVYRRPLGEWIRPPHFKWRCFYSPDKDTIHILVDSGFTNWNKRVGRTRLEQGYICAHGSTSSHCGYPATIQRLQVNGEVRLLSPVAGPRFPVTVLPLGKSLWDILDSWGGQWMWESIQFDSIGPDMAWLSQSFRDRTLIGVADGSYDRKRAPRACGTGWILCDRVSRHKLAGSFVEVSSSASSFRGEMLGLCAMHFLILALEELTSWHKSLVTVSCDNEVAVNRANGCTRRVKPRWACSDILRSFRNTQPSSSLSCCSSTFTCTWTIMWPGKTSRWKSSSTVNVTYLLKPHSNFIGKSRLLNEQITFFLWNLSR